MVLFLACVKLTNYFWAAEKMRGMREASQSRHQRDPVPCPPARVLGSVGFRGGGAWHKVSLR